MQVSPPLWTMLPFVGVLLSLALGPLLCPRVWHHHLGKIMLGWGLGAVFGLSVFMTPSGLFLKLMGVFINEYFPFMCFIGALYVISSNLTLTLHGTASAGRNTLILLAGALAANVMGTLGASLVFIRPFLKLNQGRPHQTHLIVFFILIVSNCGGCLTPLGDPPLFLGYLNGVSFLWTAQALWAPFMLVVGSLLILFYVLDYWYGHAHKARQPLRIQLTGAVHALLLGAFILTLLLIPLWECNNCHVKGVEIDTKSLLRDAVLGGLAGISWMLSRRQGFLKLYSWAPFVEVAKVFAAIFVCVVPIFKMLNHDGPHALTFLIEALSPGGNPSAASYYWITGILSAFLDNAPTYLLFFHLAGGDAVSLMTTQKILLQAISLGAVFFGAMTYIGNAPNFMVKALAEEYEIQAPSFGAYMLWAAALLGPLLWILSKLWFE
jgi:Na+/H+ antiporter NhaD/arsenite permease-like protein